MRRISKLLFLSATAIIPSSLFAISCIKTKDIYLDINKASRLFLNRLTLNQIASIEKDFKNEFGNGNGLFFYFDKKDKKDHIKYFDDVKIEKNDNEEPKMFLKKGNEWLQYIPDFIYKKNWKQEVTTNNNIRVLHSTKNSNIKDFLTEYDFNEIDDLSNDYEEWLINLFAKKNSDFKPQQYEYPEDLQSIIFRLNNDITNNFFIMNRNYIKNAKNEQILFLDWMQPHYIQAKAFLDDEHTKQRKTFEKILKLYLNQFNLNVASIEINWDKNKVKIKKSITSSQDYIVFNFKSIKDWNGKELLSEEDKNTNFYLNGFRSYASNGKFGVGLQGLKEELPLFNDYVENPLLYMDGKEYLTIIDNINHFIKAPTSPEYWNSKGLMHLFNQFKDEIFTILVPKYRQKDDLSYKIIDFEFSDYLGTNQLFKAIVEVTKKDNTKKKYVWISSNFDDHGHRLKGMIHKNTKTPVPNDIYSFNPGNKGNPKGIKLDEFISKNPSSAFMNALNNASKKLDLFNYWNNDSRQNFDANLLNKNSFQIKVFNSYLNNYLLAYALEVKEKIPLSGIKKIDIELDAEKNKLGSLYFKLKFIGFGNPHDYKYESKDEKLIAEVQLYWNYFKGYDSKLEQENFSFFDDKKKIIWIDKNEKI
ncbi:Hypothetical protein, predicted lipoprotein [Metamycoplasma auris 15026]|uniref:Lipoprotein n=1 Tax=Metamycoplasma auris 15026 TaxID=1188233 RepID=N9TQY6_9BACT|nr:hypothetical protein [Metamycoplasma auris]ENY68485.1 Hypothetical protein, predicted lipoprotein [Metamycoplasma auris 15026]